MQTKQTFVFSYARPTKFWGPMKVFCHSVNVDGVLVLLGGSGGPSTLSVVTELV